MAATLARSRSSILIIARPWIGRFFCSETVVTETQNAGLIGFVGLGNMGGPMCKNLLKEGHKVIVNDLYPEAMAELKDLGAETAASPDLVAAQSKLIITMLPSSPNVQEVYGGSHGIFKTVQAGTLLIDSSTIDPAVAKEMAVIATKKGTTYLDAPVSGGVVAAAAGTLTFMVGGSKEGYDKAESILVNMGKNVIHCGDSGTGQAAKICNNMLLAISMIGVSESMNLGMRLGLDSKMLAKIVNTSTGRCWSSELYNPVPGVVENVPSSNNYKGGFGVALMAKDLGLAQNAATATKSATPLGSLAHQIYRVMCNKGYSNLDFSSAFKFLRDDK